MTPPYNGLKSLPVQSEGSSSLCVMFMFRGIYSQFPSVNPPNARMLTLSLFLIHLHSLPMSAQWQSKARFSKMITKLDRWAATWHFFFPLHENVQWFSCIPSYKMLIFQHFSSIGRKPAVCPRVLLKVLKPRERKSSEGCSRSDWPPLIFG